MYMQAPHSRQSSERMSNGVEIFRLWPRCWNPMASASICSAQIRDAQSAEDAFLVAGREPDLGDPELGGHVLEDLRAGGHGQHQLDHHPARLPDPGFESVRTTSPSSAG